METAKLASEDKARCRYCKKIFPLFEVLAVFWRGNLLFSACEACHKQYPVVMKRVIRKGRESLYVGPLRESDKPSDIVVAPSMNVVDKLVGGARGKPKRIL